MRSAATSSAVLFNEGLDPGVRVRLDDRVADVATVCSTEKDAPYCFIRLANTGQHVRVASWRLDRLR